MHEDDEDEDLLQPSLKDEDVKYPNVWHVEECKLLIARFVKNEDCILKTIEN